MKKLIIAMAIILLVLGAGIFFMSDLMPVEFPESGPVKFHDMNITIPENFRVSADESNRDLWDYYGDGKDMVITRTHSDDTKRDLNNFTRRLSDRMIPLSDIKDIIEETTFNGYEARTVKYDSYDETCRVMVFAVGKDIYMIETADFSLDEFNSLLETVSIDD